ncbi:MAG: prepilin-type N-terminal cleavage/methylation domain-containing protein [Ruminococcus sp.]|nr:prepilin-type N-terminal cleavage/methylation domain-containing protein [Ruminococcus sp.]
MKRSLKKGFTLVELLVVLMLMGIITTCIAMAIRPVTQLYADINYKYEEENGAITSFDFINGDLRYATKVEIVSRDSQAEALGYASSRSGDYKNFMLFSNDSRPNSNKGARGYVSYGLTSGTADWKYVVSKELLGENDFQFSLDSYNTAAGEQSMTITAIAQPMKMTADGAGFQPYNGWTKPRSDMRKCYTYKEAIQFVNMSHASALNLTVNFNVNLTSDKNILVLYSKPKDLPAAPVSVGPTGSAIGPHNEADRKKNTVKYDAGGGGAPAGSPKLIVHFYNTANDPWRSYKLVKDGCAWSRSDGETSAAEVINSKTVDVEVTSISTGNTFRVRTDFGGEKDIFTMSDTDFAALTADKHVYIWHDAGTPTSKDDFIQTGPYTPPGGLSPTKLLKIHYIPCDSDPGGIGLMIRDGDTVSLPSASVSFNGTVREVPNNGKVFCQDSSEEIYAEVEFTMEHAAVVIGTAEHDWDSSFRKEYCTISVDYELVGDEMEIWLYDGEWSENKDDLELPVDLNKEILLHYMWSPGGSTKGLLFKDKDGVPHSSTTSEGAIPDNPNSWDANVFTRKADGSFDITVTLIKSAAVVDVIRHDAGAWSSGFLTLNSESADEYWIYNDVAYANKSDVPGMGELNKKINLHYVGGYAYTDGLVIIDNDSLNESVKVGDDLVADNGMYDWFAGESGDVTVTLVYASSSAKVAFKSTGTGFPDDEAVVTLDNNSQDDYWFYCDKCYNSEAEANEAKAAAEASTAGPETTEMSVTRSGISAAVKAFYKRMAFGKAA